MLFQWKLFSPTHPHKNDFSSIYLSIHLSIYHLLFFFFLSATFQSLVPPLLPRRSISLCLLSPARLPLPSFWVCSGTPLIQRPSGNSYPRSVGFNQTPLACRHILSSKGDKRKSGYGKSQPPPLPSSPSTPINLLIMTLTETIFSPLSLSLDMPVFFSSPSLSSHVFNIPLALLSFHSSHGSLTK